jgi:hypothetical protein
MAPEERKRRKRERFKQRYDEDQEFRAKNNAACRVRHQRNKAKINAERRRRYATDPEFRAAARADSKKSSRKSLLKKNYGMSLEEYAAKLAGQGGVCVICLEGHEKSLCVDHDHKTRKLRDLLCTNCNVGLGNYNDDPALMRRGADYLEYWQRCHANPDNTGAPPFATGSRHDVFAPSLPSIQSPPLTGEVMTPSDETTEAGKASRMMRRALLHELLRPFDPDPPPPVDMLQAVSRAIVGKASQGDMTAAKEILDRIDGKTLPAAPEPDQAPAIRQVNVSWKKPI